MRVFPKAIVLTTKSRFDVKRTYGSIRGLVVRTIALGKTRISAIGDAKIAKNHIRVYETIVASISLELNCLIVCLCTLVKLNGLVDLMDF